MKESADKLSHKNFGAHQSRILSNISETAEEKYNSFTKSYPTVYNRVPLHMVAFFVGPSCETLSRVIRRQNIRKDRG